MSIERAFRPTEDMMSEFKPWTNDTEASNKLWLRSVTADIIVKCMSDNTEEKTQLLYKEFTGLLRMVGLCARDSARYGIWRSYSDSDNGLLWIYGSQGMRADGDDLEETVLDVAETLTVMAKTVKCDSYFDKDSNWFEFRDEIKGKVEYLCEVFHDSETAEIIEKLKDTELGEDDFDEYGNVKKPESEVQDNL